LLPLRSKRLFRPPSFAKCSPDFPLVRIVE